MALLKTLLRFLCPVACYVSVTKYCALSRHLFMTKTNRIPQYGKPLETREVASAIPACQWYRRLQEPPTPYQHPFPSLGNFRAAKTFFSIF